jgi:hypothetical protein
MDLTDMHPVRPVIMKRASQRVGAGHGRDHWWWRPERVAAMGRSYGILSWTAVRCFLLKTPVGGSTNRMNRGFR